MKISAAAELIPPMAATARLRRIEVNAVRKFCPVLEPLTVTEWADKYRILPETSTAPGPYRSSVVPYARRPQDLMADPGISMLALCFGGQLTKSTMVENAIGYRIARMPCPIVYVRPKIEDCEGWVKERFVPMVLVTPELRRRVRIEKTTDPTKASPTLRFKSFGGGFLFVASATSHAELVSRSAPFMPIDEVDLMEMLTQGNPVKIALGRQSGADVAMAVLTSTPRLSETSQIWPLLEGGTFERYFVPCPHCDTYQVLVWGGANKPHGLKWPSGRPAAAEYLCESCACTIDEKYKRDMLQVGDWRPQNPAAPYPSFHLNQLYSPFRRSSWGVLAETWLAAQGKPRDLQVFVNESLAETYEEDGTEAVDAHALGGDRMEEELKEGRVPTGVGVLTLGVDAQRAPERLEWYLWGWGHGLESWLIASGVIVGDPQIEPGTPGSVWEELDQVWKKKWPHEGGRLMPVEVTGIDSGYARGAVYRYTKPRHRFRVFPTKGVGGEKVPLISKLSPQTQERILLLPIGTDMAKDEFLRSQIYETKHGPGFVHLPAWLTEDQCKQLVAEKRKRRMVKGNPVYEWHRKTAGQPNEALDCRIICRAMLELLGSKVIENLGRHAARWATPPAEPASSTQVAPPAAPRGRRIISRGIE